MPPYVPPGYKDLHIFNDPNSKVYAYGYDKKGRKQIIYNPWFIEQQRQQRFQKIIELKSAIKKMQSELEHILNASSPAKSKDVQIAVILKLMLLCNFRIGNVKYLKDNGSYGLTTLQWNHVNLFKNYVEIEFIGKKGVVNKSTCDDKIITKILTQMKKESSSSNVFSVSSKNVNIFLQQFGNMTTKDIRTWHANYLFVKYYRQAQQLNISQEECNIKKYAIANVAKELHNTPVVCKKNYLLPELCM